MNSYKFFKTVFILNVLLIFLLSLCTVYSEDVNNHTFIEKYDDDCTLIDESENEELLGKTYYLNGGKFSDIQKIVDKAKSGDTIKLTGSFKSEGKQITINKKLTITSTDKAILDGNGKSRIFKINSNAKGIKINNIIFKGAYSKNNGGAIYLNASNAIITKCSFNNCIAHSGGAISTSTAGHITNLAIKDSEFYSNHGFSAGGAILYAGKNLEITSSSFDNNFIQLASDGWGGGALQIGLENQDNNCKITNCLFKNNYVSYNSESKGHAGVACLRRGVTFKNCNFTNNMACSYGVLGFHDGGSVINCKFYNNYAMESGGALGFDTSNQKINIVNSDFENNTAKNGGAIYLNSKGQIENCRFINNIATHCGGAIYSNSKINIITSNFTQNIANNGGASYINEEANIFDSNFMENIAEYGGAIHSKSQLTMNDSLFKNNSALNGSAIYNNGILNIYKSHFNSNKAKSYNITSTNNAPVKKGEYLIIKVKLLVGDTVLDAIYNNGNVSIDNDKPIESNLAIKQEILLILNNETYIVKTNEYGIAEFIIDTSNLNAENYTYFFIHIDCELYTGINDNDTVEILENNQQPKTKKDNELLSSPNNNHEVNHYKTKTKTKTKIHSNLKDYLKNKGYTSVNDLIKDNTNKYPYHVDNNHHKLKNKYRNDKGFDDYLYNMWKINWPHKYNIVEFLKDGAYMNVPLLLCIGNLALPLLITSYYINGKIHEAKIKTNGDFWKTLNEPIIHFYGYKTHFADEKGGKALVDFLLGIDENGDMSIGNALINSISLICGFKIGSEISFRISETTIIETYMRRNKLFRTFLKYGEVIKEGLFDIFSMVSEPINVLNVIVSRIGKTFLDGSSRVYDSLYSFFNNPVRNIFYFLNPANQQNAENNIKNLTLKKTSLSKIKDIAKRSVNKVKTFIKKINNKLHKVVKKVKTKLNKFFKNVKKIVKKVQNKVTNIVKNIKTTVKTVMKKVNKIIKKVKNTIKRVTKKVKTIVKQVKSNVKKIKKKTNKVIKNIKSTVKTIKNKTTHTLTKHVNKLVKKVKNNVKKIKTKTKRIIKKIKNNIQQVKTKAQKIVDNAKTKVQQFKKAVEHNYNLAKNKIKNGYQIMKTKCQNGYNWAKNKAKTAFNWIKTNVNNGLKWIRSKIF